MNKTIDYYNSHAKELTSRYEGADVTRLHARLTEIFPAGSRILEIGSGSGREAAFLMASGRIVSCIEASEKMANESIRIHPELSECIFVGSVPDYFPFSSETFDGIYAVASLMHVKRTRLPLTLRLIRASLVATGRFLMSIPLERSGLDDRGIDDDGRFFLMLNKSEWEKSLTDAGFSILDSEIIQDGLNRSDVVWGTWVCGL